ncbi:hypothetical protein SLEP1_g51410 [Rubroshorea leprosula]|uniref:Uncharacterized protein n=1 Tax=Rubroshorea leprosula TaxID=152421 RepID=A0AAV5M349_9ROSI|nr:hypothetical protein SLEP1_g51410 [Rubroshorea leprosula]
MNRCFRFPFSSHLSPCNSTQPLALAALQLITHLQLSSKAAAGSSQPASHRGTLPSARHCKSAPLTSSSSKAGLSSFSFCCRVASSSAALPQILFKLSNSRYQLDAVSKATIFVLCFSSDNNGNFFNLFEELEENDNEDDEFEEVISST